MKPELIVSRVKRDRLIHAMYPTCSGNWININPIMRFHYIIRGQEHLHTN